MPDSVFWGRSPLWIHIVLPIWGKEHSVALTTSPPVKEMKTTSFVYPHTVAKRTLSNICVMLSTIWHYANQYRCKDRFGQCNL